MKDWGFVCLFIFLFERL